MAYSQPSSVPIAPAFRQWQFLDFLRAGRVPPTWQDTLKGDPMMQRVAMVFELAIGGAAGRVIRMSTVPVRSVSSRTGQRHDAMPVLIEEPRVSAQYGLGEGSSAARQFDMTIDGRFIEPMTLIRSGAILCGIAEVAFERTDVENDYDLRYVLLRGDLHSVSFGAVRSPGAGRPDDRELVSLQIVDPRDSVSSKLPPWVLDVGRIASLHTSGVGGTYPIVVNRSYRHPTVRASSAATGPNSFIVAQGIVTVGGSGNVFLNGVSVFGGVNAWVVEQAVDAQGLTYTRIRFTNGGKAWVDSDAVHVICTAPVTGQNPVACLRRVLESYSPLGVAGVNPELFATAEAKYPSLGDPRVVINASGGAAASVLDWVENGFLTSYPMLSMVWSAGGYGPVLTDSRAAPLAKFTVPGDVLLDRVSQVTETSKGEILNEVVVKWGYDPMLDSYAGVVTRSPSNSALCAYSQQLVGRRDANPIDSPYIADEDSAEYVADWIVQHRALPSYIVQYDAVPGAFIRYQLGDTVVLTDTDLGWTEERATIDAMEYVRGKCTVTFRVWLRALDVGSGALSRPSTL